MVRKYLRVAQLASLYIIHVELGVVMQLKFSLIAIRLSISVVSVVKPVSRLSFCMSSSLTMFARFARMRSCSKYSTLLQAWGVNDHQNLEDVFYMARLYC